MTRQDQNLNILKPATRKIARLLREELPDEESLQTALATLARRWVEADPEHLLRQGKTGRLLSATAQSGLRTACRDVRWMVDPHKHHGQQAAKLAGKTLRAVQSRRIGFEIFQERAAEFHRLRHAAIRGRWLRKPRGKALEIDLPGAAASATRIVTEQELVQLGREAQNCFADPKLGKLYLSSLRRRKSEFWRIDDGNGILLCVLEATRSETRCLRAAEGPGGAALTHQAAAALLEFLRIRKVSVRRCCGLEEHGIYREKIVAVHDPERIVAAFDGTSWDFEIVPGAVLARCAFSGEAWLLRNPGTSGTERPFFQVAAADDDTLGFEPQYWQEARMRSRLRQACRENPDLEAALGEAFDGASPDFREDWLGT